MTSRLPKRYDVTEATRMKFKGRAFEWGHSDCLVMTRAHLVGFGHSCPRIPSYKTALGAVRALERAGHASIKSLFDSMDLPGIPPAAMILGDIAIMESEPDNPLDAIVICIGQNVMGWHDGADELVEIIPRKIKAAWSVML